MLHPFLIYYPRQNFHCTTHRREKSLSARVEGRLEWTRRRWRRRWRPDFVCYANKAGIEDRKIKAVVVFSYKKRKAKQKNIEEGRETLAVRQSDRQTNNNGSSVLIFGLESNTCLGGEYLSREMISRRHSELELFSEVRIGHCNDITAEKERKKKAYNILQYLDCFSIGTCFRILVIFFPPECCGHGHYFLKCIQFIQPHAALKTAVLSCCIIQTRILLLEVGTVVQTGDRHIDIPWCARGDTQKLQDNLSW